jgi:ketosteroid isomerase-like protein
MTIDWKNEPTRHHDGQQPTDGETAVSAADNKKLMQTIYAGIAAGDRTAFQDALADDVTMTVTGQYSWSQTFHGKESVLRDLYGYVRSLLKENRRTVPFRFIADDEWVVVEARGEMETTNGERYDNHYCLIYRIGGGQIREIREYQDSTLCERVLGEFPQERKRAAG